MSRVAEALKQTNTGGELAAASATSLTTTRQQSTGDRLLSRLRHERKVLIGVAIIALLAILAIFGPALAPYHPDNDDFAIMQAPSMQHPMGTDSFGRDLFSRLIVGTRVSFTVGVLSAALALAVGGLLVQY